MSIVKAIARVRRGAREAGLEGALASLGSELRSDAIPEPFRDAAARLATLFAPAPSPASGARVESRKGTVVALEDALEAKVAQAAHSAHAGAALSPEHAQLLADKASDARCPFTGIAADGARAQVEAANVSDAGHEPASGPASSEGARVSRVREAGSDRAAEPERREKDKEGLAGARTVEKTSARSATRSVQKQPRSRAKGRKKA